MGKSYRTVSSVYVLSTSTTTTINVHTDIFFINFNINILLFWKVADGWEYLASDGNKYVFYTALEPNEALTEKDFIAGGKITASVATYDAYDALRSVDLKVNVTAYAVQANGFAVSNNMEDNVIAAWNSIKNK